jgi:hypothetical protein
MRVLFCGNLVDRKGDPDFEEEYKSIERICTTATDIIKAD